MFLLNYRKLRINVEIVVYTIYNSKLGGIIIIRNFIDYHKYVFRIRTKESITLIIDIVLFTLSMIAFKNQLTNYVLGININWNYLFIILGIFFNFIYTIYSIVSQIKQHLDLRYGEVFNKNIQLGKVVVSDVESKNGFKIEKCKINSTKEEYVLNSNEVDAYLWENEIKLIHDKNMEVKIKRLMRDNKEQLMHFLTWQYRISKF